MDMHLSKLPETVEDRGACVLQSAGSGRAGHDSVTEQQQRWKGREVAREVSGSLGGADGGTLGVL